MSDEIIPLPPREIFDVAAYFAEVQLQIIKAMAIPAELLWTGPRYRPDPLRWRPRPFLIVDNTK